MTDKRNSMHVLYLEFKKNNWQVSIPEINYLGITMEWKELYSNGQNTGIIAEHKKIHEQRCFILLKKKKVD